MRSIVWKVGNSEIEEFEIYQVEFGQVRCRLNAASGNVIDESRDYSSAPSSMTIVQERIVKGADTENETINRWECLRRLVMRKFAIQNHQAAGIIEEAG